MAPRRVPAFPVDAADDRRCELGDGGERDQPDRNQRVRFAREIEVDVAQHEHDDDRAAPDREEQGGEVGAFGQLELLPAQQDRHDEVVADHGGERDRLHDHHAGRGGEAADECEESERRLSLRDRQRQDERVGIHAAGRKVQQSAERDRHHEDVDRQEIQREEPDRFRDVALVHVLHDGHLKLPRQEHDREHRKKHERRPGRVVAARAAEHEQRVQVGDGARALEDVARSRRTSRR